MVYQYVNHTVPWYISVLPRVNHLIAFKEHFKECRKWKLCLKNIYKCCNCFCRGSILLCELQSHLIHTQSRLWIFRYSRKIKIPAEFICLISIIWRSEGACSSTANNRCVWPYRKCIMANSLQSDKLISSGNICVNMSHTVRSVNL